MSNEAELIRPASERNAVAKYAESDTEVAFTQGLRPAGEGKRPEIEIVTTGAGASLVFINGARIGYITRIQIPRSPGKISPLISLDIHAGKITERFVSNEEFRELAKLQALDSPASPA